MTMHKDGPAATMVAALAQGLEAVDAEERECPHCGWYGECVVVLNGGAALLGSLAVWEA